MTEGPFLEVLHISIIICNLGEKLAKREGVFERHTSTIITQY